MIIIITIVVMIMIMIMIMTIEQMIGVSVFTYSTSGSDP